MKRKVKICVQYSAFGFNYFFYRTYLIIRGQNKKFIQTKQTLEITFQDALKVNLRGLQRELLLYNTKRHFFFLFPVQNHETSPLYQQRVNLSVSIGRGYGEIRVNSPGTWAVISVECIGQEFKLQVLSAVWRLSFRRIAEGVGFRQRDEKKFSKILSRKI